MKVFKLCLPFLKKYKAQLIVFSLLSIVTGILGVFLPYFGGMFIDILTENAELDIIIRFGLYLLLISILMIIVGYLVNRLQVKILTHGSFYFIRYVLEHLKGINILYLSDKQISFIAQQSTSDINALISFCVGVISGTIIRLATVIVLSIVIYSIEPMLSLVFLVVLVLYSVIFLIFRPIVFKVVMDAKNAQDGFFAHIYEYMSKIGFIKTNSIGEDYSAKLSGRFKTMFSKIRKQQDVTYLFGSADIAITTMTQVAVFIIGGLSVVRGSMTIGFFSILLNTSQLLHHAS